jgi:DNA-binding NtrC family response regulator
LENIIEHAFVLCHGGLIQLAHLPSELRGASEGEASPSLAGMTLEAMERLLITDALRRHHGNRSATAKHLGINPSALFRKAKSLGIELPKADGRQR